MSEATPATEVTTEPAPTATDAPPATDKSFTQAELDRIVAERLQRERSKVSDYDDLKAKAAEFDKLTEEQKSEQQKILDRQAAIERERDEAKADGLRYKAAAKHGIGEDYFDLLGSGDEEAIVGRAERVGTLIRENAEMKAELEALRAGKPAPASGRPTEALKPGATPEHAKSEDDETYESLFGAPAS